MLWEVSADSRVRNFSSKVKLTRKVRISRRAFYHNNTMSNTRRIVLLGKSGWGKSSLGNTILGDDHAFTVNHTPNAETRVCRAVTRTIHRRLLTVIDTPGLFDTEAPISAAFSPEIMRCLEESAPGPHAFLLVLKKENFTAQERAVVDLILYHFSSEALRFTTIVVTHGEDLQAGERIEDWARQNDYLRDLLIKCGNRCHVVDNRNWRNRPGQIYRNNQNQVLDLLDTIDRAVMANGNTFFTSALQNRSLWRRFRDAPIGFQIAAILGVSAVACLLYSTVPWAQVSLWVVQGASNGAAWVWQNLPTGEGIKQAIVYLAAMYKMFLQIRPTTERESESSSYCAIM